MRDSIGGALLFWIVLILLSIFIIFIAFIIKYAHIYKIKNSIVNYVERNEGVVSKEEFDLQLLELGYSGKGGYKICRYLSDNKDKGGYYFIELYSLTTFPIVGDVLAIKIPIRGETRNITTGTKIRSTDSNWFTSLVSECKSCEYGSNCITTDA